jgi:peptidoglycan-associated lipoprotein
MRRIALTTGLVAVVALGGCAMGARRSMVRAEPVCRDVSVPIYFDAGASRLTRDGRRVIAMAAADARGCSVDKVQVMGLADAEGEAAANLELSKARAASVSDALVRAKLPPAEFDVAAAGQAGAVTKAGAAQPLRRRADVVLKLSAPKPPKS